MQQLGNSCAFSHPLDMQIPHTMSPCASHPAFLPEESRDQPTSFQLFMIKKTTTAGASRCVPVAVLSVWRSGISRGKIKPIYSAYPVKIADIHNFRAVELEWCKTVGGPHDGCLCFKADRWSPGDLLVPTCIICKFVAQEVWLSILMILAKRVPVIV